MLAVKVSRGLLVGHRTYDDASHTLGKIWINERPKVPDGNSVHA